MHYRPDEQRWFEDGRLRIEFNRLSLINRFEIDVEFEDRDARIVVAEPTELGTVGARRRERVRE